MKLTVGRFSIVRLCVVLVKDVRSNVGGSAVGVDHVVSWDLSGWGRLLKGKVSKIIWESEGTAGKISVMGLFKHKDLGAWPRQFLQRP